MEIHTTLNSEPQLRFIIACPRSGSTLLMRIFAESASCAVTSRLMLQGGGALHTDDTFTPDYSILERPSQHPVYRSAKEQGKRFLVCKEELGKPAKTPGHIRSMQPNTIKSVYALARPVVLIRDPIRVFDSWKKVGWTDVHNFILCYTTGLEMLEQAPPHLNSCLLYEQLIQQPEKEIQRICERWGLPFSESMMTFKQPFGSAFLYSSERDRTIYCEENPHGIFTTVEAKSSVGADVEYHNLLSRMEKDIIEVQLGSSYINCWTEDTKRLRGILSEKTWIGFDLDDTLHEFRRSSGIATKAVLERISQQYGHSIVTLQSEYLKVLKVNTANAFADRKTSFDYRRERFCALLEQCSLPQEEWILSVLLDLYETTLMDSLELKNGAREVLKTVKTLGKKVVVITEGPQDAQERTIDALGIRPYVDFIATTNHFGQAKTEGLFARVLEHLNVFPGDMAYIGDNEQRDMRPAMAEGIFSLHLAEAKHVSLNTHPPCLNSLRKLQWILGDNTGFR